ncbi:RING finger and CHY zinc finger domain-containing protein 1 [Biomphalaria glabrata]|nr:RING finger and CHY zinc finger domain-containing protein 1-like [Biomphalaria glabrata]
MSDEPKEEVNEKDSVIAEANIANDTDLENVTNLDKCNHYTRNCKLKAPCCSVFYSCRFCHDEDNDHEMDRHKVMEVQCKRCDTIQEVRKDCSKCGIIFGEYFCPICRLYDVPKHQFHCLKCGICRVGPEDKYYHCDTCNACLSLELKGQHKCIENVSRSLCPICQEFLHTSRSGIEIPRCGHMIHQECLKSCAEQRLYQCPVCKESLWDMKEVWQEMDEVCAAVQLPEELVHVKLFILCQDCHKTCEQFFNTEGLKCIHCGSYNTTQTSSHDSGRP